MRRGYNIYWSVKKRGGGRSKTIPMWQRITREECRMRYSLLIISDIHAYMYDIHLILYIYNTILVYPYTQYRMEIRFWVFWITVWFSRKKSYGGALAWCFGGGVLDLPIGIDILMNLRTHQGASARVRTHAHTRTAITQTVRWSKTSGIRRTPIYIVTIN